LGWETKLHRVPGAGHQKFSHPANSKSKEGRRWVDHRKPVTEAFTLCPLWCAGKGNDGVAVDIQTKQALRRVTESRSQSQEINNRPPPDFTMRDKPGGRDCYWMMKMETRELCGCKASPALGP